VLNHHTDIDWFCLVGVGRQRPRKLGAKYTGHDIAPDEFVQPSLEFDYEGKRDRWNGYDPAAYRHVVDDYQKLEETKRQLKAQKMEAALLEGALDESVAKVTLLMVLCSILAFSAFLLACKILIADNANLPPLLAEFSHFLVAILRGIHEIPLFRIIRISTFLDIR